MTTISVYHNPYASGASYKFLPEIVKKYFFRYDLKFRNPGSHRELVEMVNQDREAGIECIFSIGGDGTAHTIAQQLIGARTKLLVLPGGTANDFAQELGTNTNIQKLALLFHSKRTKKVDIIKVNDHYLITNGGTGIAQKVADEVNQYRKSSALFHRAMKVAGKNTYSLMFAKKLLLSEFKRHHLFIDSPDFPQLEKRVHSPLVLINNQPQLAGRFPVAPTTRNNDGKFNVTIFTHTNRFDFLRCVSVFLSGKFPTFDPQVIHFETNALTMTSLNDEDLHFFGDGENFSPSKELNIQIIPNALEVYSGVEDPNLCLGLSLDSIPLIQ